MRRVRASVAAGGLLALVACNPKPPATASAPPDASAPPPASTEVSRFSVPLQYDFSTMVRVVEHVVPTTFGSMDSVRMIGTDERRHYAFEASRGPFTAFAEGNQVHLRATVAYRAQGFYKPPIGPTLSAGCGGERESERPRVVIELAAPLTLTPDWHLASKAKVVRVAPASNAPRDHCDVTLLHRDMTPRVVEAARSALVSHLGDIDRKVAEVDLRDHFEEWWGLLAKPIQLADGVWLVLAPQRLRMGAVSGRDKVLTVPVSLDARPRIVTGRDEPSMRSSPLPPLAHDTVSNGFHIAMDGFVDYLTASRALASVLAGKTVVEGTRSVMVQRIAVTPAPKGQLALSVTFVGDAR
ncbi:MAG: DUF4403 family protein, partial [Gemmatimonadaceae bacterium]